MLLFALGTQGTHHIELYKGVALPDADGPKHYWSVEDTTLDSTQAELNQGGVAEIYAGEGQTILLQFGDLRRALGKNKKITKAQLVLTVTSNERPTLISFGTVNLPWNEGPNRTLVSSFRPKAPGEVEKAARWSATWRHRREAPDTAGWERAGAQGEGDVKPIPDVKMEMPADLLIFSGLESVVQHQYDQPFDNHGFAMRFRSPMEFLSSNALKGRPKLVLDYVDAPATTGPDLAVTLIERNPEYERYDNNGGYSYKDQAGQSVAVLDHPLNALNKKVPFDGEQIVYTAHVKNVGDAPANGFSGSWYVNEKQGAAVGHPESIAPGEEATVAIQLPFKNVTADHRVQPLTLVVTPKDEANSWNNTLTIGQGALPVAMYGEKSFAAKVRAQTGLSFEEWCQEQVRLVNDVYFPYSRFSFAPDGVVERIRLASIRVLDDGALKGDRKLPDGKVNLNFDSEVGFAAADAVPSGEAAVRSLFDGLGLTDLATMNVVATGGRGTIVKSGQPFARTMTDRFPGIMGGGDTRDDTAMYPTFSIPYEPFFDVVAEQSGLVPTDLLSSISVAELNSNIGKRRGINGDALYDIPGRVLVTVTDYSNHTIPNVTLSFYQSANGVIDLSTPTFTGVTSAKGTYTLPQRDAGVDANFTTPTGHALKQNPFGRIDYKGGNGVFLVKAEVRGVTDYTWLKLWQVSDTYHRGQEAIALMSLRVNLPTDTLETGTDVAKEKAVSDSASTAPASLAPLLSGKNDTPVQLSGAAGAWVEIDLGRDRPVGEVRLFSNGSPFWNSFEVKVYGTGQKPEEARIWARELDWPWSIANRKDTAGAVSSLAYRGEGARIRFIRIVNKTEVAGPVSLNGIAVVPFKVADGG